MLPETDEVEVDKPKIIQILPHSNSYILGLGNDGIVYKSSSHIHGGREWYPYITKFAKEKT